MDYNLLFISLFALSFGSFYNVLIVRVPQNISLFTPSRCNYCSNQIKWYHNIPILSYFILKGRCINCQEKISIRYIVVEFVTMLLGIIVYIKFGLSIDSILLFFILSLFFVLSVIDYDYHAVPDSINLMALSLSLFYIDFYSAIQSALMVAGAMALLRYYLSFILQKESMGEGDIILGATMGAILGIKLSFFALFLASIIALPFALYDKIKSKNGLVPFIPFLSIATILVIFEKEYFYNLLVKLYE